jgi:hypothetical protein
LYSRTASFPDLVDTTGGFIVLNRLLYTLNYCGCDILFANIYPGARSGELHFVVFIKQCIIRIYRLIPCGTANTDEEAINIKISVITSEFGYNSAYSCLSLPFIPDWHAIIICSGKGFCAIGFFLDF